MAAPSDLGPVSASPHAVVAAALELARVGPGDVLVDVGCGSDGACVLAHMLFNAVLKPAFLAQRASASRQHNAAPLAWEWSCEKQPC
jgi:precorrin-6B methylase 2